MSIQFPSIQRYILGLLTAIIIGVIIHFLMSLLGFSNLSPLTLVIIGLFIGHFFGAVSFNISFPDTKRTQAGSGTVKTIYVGNLAFRASRHDLQRLFEQYGEVQSTRIMIDRETRRSRGFGFVEMNDRDAKKAINALDGSEFNGRELRVNEANDKVDRR